MGWLRTARQTARGIARDTRDGLRSLAYRGTGRHCPVCGRDARAFLTWGDPPRADARCPHCGSLERHRLVWRFFEDHTDLFDGRPKSVLHIAPEHCMQPLLEARLGPSYLSADLFRPNAAIRLDLTDMPFPDATIDVVYCAHVLEHIPDDRAAMREIHRVLRPEGWALLLVPMRDADTTYEDPTITDPAARRVAFGQEDHVRWYGRDFVDRLREAGLTVERLGPDDVLDAVTREHFGVTDAAGDMYMARR